MIDQSIAIEHLREIVSKSISSAFHASIVVGGSGNKEAVVILQENHEIENGKDYYSTGDRTNKIIAIEAPRWLRDMPALQHLRLKVPDGKGDFHEVQLDRDRVEQYLGGSLEVYRNDADKWREEFLSKYDNKESRAKFVETFCL
ncbi:MAG: hypothetical protein KDD67_07305 [Ignavibacteriae bacterium]|nr:hypothetical protein [Ignavibacteriota bacterium]MCB9217253.1 hypothetical protein [Ignavibacteria bacterium]